MAKVDSRAFYGEYHGHTVAHLHAVHDALRIREAPNGTERPIIFLCGDSTLDNKYWFHDRSNACNGYERVLEPAVMREDVSYWVNRELADRGLDASCLNCAIEESTLAERDGSALLPQDTFIREHLRSQDVLVVSCGGNDIALRPSAWTIMSIAALMMSPRWLLATGWAPGMGHIVRLFGARTRSLVERLCAQCPEGGPRTVVVCMLYYLDEAPTPSWANGTLAALGYDKDPTKLQLLMRKTFEHATSRIRLRGTNVVALPFYEALDGSDPADYVQRVEPSSKGGRKMARAVVDKLAAVLA